MLFYSALSALRFHPAIWLPMILGYVLVPYLVHACATRAGREGEVITDPTFTFSVSPPVRWTYYPPIQATAGTTIANFFPGQSSTSTEAQQAAQNEILAAYLEALSTSLRPANDITTAVTYSPDPISNCYIAQPIPPGTRIGFLAGGAITETALVQGTGGTGATVTQCPLSNSATQQGVGPYTEYIKQISIATRGGITQSHYEWERVASQLQSILNFRYQTLFRSPITIT